MLKVVNKQNILYNILYNISISAELEVEPKTTQILLLKYREINSDILIFCNFIQFISFPYACTFLEEKQHHLMILFLEGSISSVFKEKSEIKTSVYKYSEYQNIRFLKNNRKTTKNDR